MNMPLSNPDVQSRTAKAVLDAISPPDTLETTLIQRGKRYGKFIKHAEVTQDLKSQIALHLAHRNKQLAPDQQEALDMICHKIGRIINGDADYDDSWTDIAGYAQLVSDRLRGVTR